MLSCAENKEDLLKKSAENWISQNANNPKSYEFVDFKIIDTLNLTEQNDTVFISLNKDLENYQRGIKGYENGIKILDRAIEQGKADENDILEGKIIRRVISKTKFTIDSLNNLIENRKKKYFGKTIYNTKLKFRINNDFNAPILHESSFFITDNNEILDTDADGKI
tara:strand:+ start:137 stop:634 length:498 start_codon:yes stop_codon:yes gene_type:complete